jgi:thiamine-monophosphate kinase
MGEFDLIARYFTRPVRKADLGVGDDCALLAISPGHQLATSCDMLVQGRHFFADVDPRTLGHKALAVNLSDLAACGAQPLAFTLALSLPTVDEAWLAAFADGLWALADAHGCELIGGDTTQGPLNICISVFGEVPLVQGRSQALLRSGAQVGDDLYVSGQVGDARLALEALSGRITLPASVLAGARTRLEMPTPRVALGLGLRGLASAAIDLSDGLAGDVQHLLERSQVGATVQADGLAQALAARHAHPAVQLDARQWRQLAMSGGDDYELLFTAAPQHRQAIAQVADNCHTAVQRIGHIDAEHGLRLVDAAGLALETHYTSFAHFA